MAAVISLKKYHKYIRCVWISSISYKVDVYQITPDTFVSFVYEHWICNTYLFFEREEFGDFTSTHMIE